MTAARKPMTLLQASSEKRARSPIFQRSLISACDMNEVFPGNNYTPFLLFAVPSLPFNNSVSLWNKALISIRCQNYLYIFLFNLIFPVHLVYHLALQKSPNKLFPWGEKRPKEKTRHISLPLRMNNYCKRTLLGLWKTVVSKDKIIQITVFSLLFLSKGETPLERRVIIKGRMERQLCIIIFFCSISPFSTHFSSHETSVWSFFHVTCESAFSCLTAST